MNRAIKYRLYPTIEQEIMFAKTFGSCRKVWNLMLEDKINSYGETGSFGKQTPAMYKEEFPFLKEPDSLALANVQINLERAIKSSCNKKRKSRTGFPNFKSKKHSRESYTTNNNPAGTSIRIIGNHIKLPKVGLVKIEKHRDPKENWIIKSATISKDSDGKFYISVLFKFEQDVASIEVDPNKVIGLDYKSDGLYIDNKGNIGSNHRFLAESKNKLAKKQRCLSRKVGSKKGQEKSNNYKKQQLKVNRLHKHIANQRKDNLHKLSTEIANQADAVCVEDLNMAAMSNKRFHNGKATMDNGYGMFLNMLEYKLTDRGKQLIRIDKWYPSSQVCSNCGMKHSEMKNLKTRTMHCSCGLVLDRDLNAAINIKNEGLKLLKEAA